MVDGGATANALRVLELEKRLAEAEAKLKESEAKLRSFEEAMEREKKPDLVKWHNDLANQLDELSLFGWEAKSVTSSFKPPPENCATWPTNSL